MGVVGKLSVCGPECEKMGVTLCEWQGGVVLSVRTTGTMHIVRLMIVHPHM